MTQVPKRDFHFTKAFEELEAIVKEFESEHIDLDEGLKKFERGLALAKQLKAKLQDVEQKIETIKQKFDSDEPKGEE
ncbi:MAG: exodeoxyribonuclease VII small subunit [Candidatus Kerfeldbacteria bacterium]|nr:exodeoxyribonuclease VII small subunit [Candidatus Kerfeldbacteria bacterium]